MDHRGGLPVTSSSGACFSGTNGSTTIRCSLLAAQVKPLGPAPMDAEMNLGFRIDGLIPRKTHDP